MKRKFANIVGPNNVSDNETDLLAYSYCASEKQLIPDLVVWPKETDEIRKIMHHVNQARKPLTIRGSGTSFTDGTIGSQQIILCTERMTNAKIDIKNKQAELQPGIKINQLNKQLSEHGLIFPFTPFNPNTTIGGMMARNPKTKESQQLNMEKFIQEIEFVDGTGKQYNTKKTDKVLGKEGITGAITKIKLKLINKPTISIDLTQHTDTLELLTATRNTLKNRQLYFLEFIDKKTSEEIGLKKQKTLIIGYVGFDGKKQELLEVKESIEKLESVHKAIRAKGYYHILDPRVTLEKSYDLINWCEKNNIALHGHIGVGQFYAYFLKEDENLIPSFKSFLKRIGGTLGQNFGRGQTNQEFLSQEEKKDLLTLKQEFDYNNLINPNKLVNYR